MWKKAILAAAVLMPAAASQFLPVRAAPEPVVLSTPAKPLPDTFAALCRTVDVVDSRRDPAWVGQSFIGDNCQAPPAPATINGFRASRDQITAGMAAVKRHAVAAEAFQRCVGNFVAARSALLSPPQAIIENHRILVSKKAAEKAAGQMRVAINQFNKYGSDCPM
jgi:hypothetical protein